MRVLSGIQPTGRPHWGNYFGAIRQYIALQDNEQAFYFIADLHALTTIRDAATLRQNSFEAALDLLALGLDPARVWLDLRTTSNASVGLRIAESRQDRRAAEYRATP